MEKTELKIWTVTDIANQETSLHRGRIVCFAGGPFLKTEDVKSRVEWLKNEIEDMVGWELGRKYIKKVDEAFEEVK